MLTVVKMGGDIVGSGTLSPLVVKDIKEALENQKMILVHGGGDEVTRIAEKLEVPQTFVTSPEGIRSRYTSRETAVIYAMVMAGMINKGVVAALQKDCINAVGLSGLDGALIRAERKRRLVIIDDNNRKRIIEGGYTGKIKSINSTLLSLLMSEGYLPVVSPIALGDEAEILNVDGDRAAAYVAGGIKADLLIFLTDVKGVYLNDVVVKKIDAERVSEILPRMGPGMEKKVLAASEAVKMGVKRAVITSGLIDNPITSVFSGDIGTEISQIQ